jgi:hypothetical protein
MSIESLVVEMRVPLSRGQWITIAFDCFSGTPDFAPLFKMNGANLAQQSAPLFLKPLKENGAGAPLLHSAPLPSHEWRKPSPSGEFLGLSAPPEQSLKQTPQEALLLAREIISELASKLAALDNRLAPVRDEERDLRDQVLATHGECNGVVILNLDRAGDRAPLFARLSEIARKWGSTKAQRGNVNRRIKALEREANQLEKAIIAERQKQRKA